MLLALLRCRLPSVGDVLWVPPHTPDHIQKVFFAFLGLAIGFHGVLLVWNGWLRLGDGFQYYVRHFRIFKCWPKVGQWAPLFIAEILYKYREIQNLLKNNILFDQMRIWKFANIGKHVYQHFLSFRSLFCIRNCEHLKFWKVWYGALEFCKINFWVFGIVKFGNT